MAPEVLSKNKYSEKADVYSFGIVLAEVFSGKLPYTDPEHKGLNQAQLMYHILEKDARPSIDTLEPALQQLIRDCWNTDPRLRPSFTEIVVRLRRLKVVLPNRPTPPVENREEYGSGIFLSSESSFDLLSEEYLTETDPLIQ